MKYHRKHPIIGIAGGMGPEAGVDLHRKIIANSLAGIDQEHPPVVHISYAHLVADRTGYLTDPTRPNPGHAIGHVINDLARLGATVAGMPCNTAHAPKILAIAREAIRDGGSSITLLHMPEETAEFCRDLKVPIGVLATNGTYRSGIYEDALSAAGLEAVMPDWHVQDDHIHNAIYNPDYGIKANARTIDPWALEHLEKALLHLRGRGARAFLLGCTELPLALTGKHWNDIPLIDPTRCLARALIRETYPEKLKPE
jgi:aspartate racemase